MWLGWRRVVCQVSGQCQSSAEWDKQVFHTVNVCLAAAGWIFLVLLRSSVALCDVCIFSSISLLGSINVPFCFTELREVVFSIFTNQSNRKKKKRKFKKETEITN